MVTLNELCNDMAGMSTANAALQQACALPRSPVDMRPLPEPHAEAPFDSSWETLLVNIDTAKKPGAGA